MPFAVVGYYDKKTDERIKLLWKAMEEIGVDNYLIHSENNPHIKFAMYEDLDINKIKPILISQVNTIEKIPVHFKSYSFYPNEKPFVSIDIATSYKILDMQTKIRNEFDKHARLYDINFFDQGIWKPDCQLTTEFDKEKLVKAINFLSQTKLPFEGIIERIGIIEFHPAKQLFSYELNE